MIFVSLISCLIVGLKESTKVEKPRTRSWSRLNCFDTTPIKVFQASKYLNICIN